MVFKKNPFRVQDSCNHPIQFYAATKKSNEMMAHSYSHLYNIPMTGLRFLLCMVHGVDQIWLSIFLQKNITKQKNSSF